MPNTNERDALIAALKFHPSASHVSPDFRDLFNKTLDQHACALAATAPNAGAPASSVPMEPMQKWTDSDGTKWEGVRGGPWKRTPASRPQCRDCADFGPICPNSGKRCDGAATDAAEPAAPAQQAGALAVTDKLIAECMASVSDPLQWGTFPADLKIAVSEFSHLFAARLMPSPNTEAKTWSAYIAGIIETYLNFGHAKEGREAAIAGIIERRMCFGPFPVSDSPQQAGAPLTLTDGQREDVLDALRNTHGLAGDVEEMLDAVLDEVAAAGAPLPLAPSDEVSDKQIDAVIDAPLGLLEVIASSEGDTRAVARLFARRVLALATPPQATLPASEAVAQKIPRGEADYALMNRIMELSCEAAAANAKANSDDGHAGTEASGKFIDLRREIWALIARGPVATRAQPQADAAEPCTVNPVSSRMCQRGTKCCVVDHEAAQAPGAAEPMTLNIETRYADAEVRDAGGKLLAVVHAGEQQSRLLSALRAAQAPGARGERT